MHVHFEQNNTTRSECTIHSLSWMGKVPDTLPEDEGGWKLNRNQYYMEGWLAGGNGKGVVGVTFTTSHCNKYDPPQRSNFNLRGHRSEVSNFISSSSSSSINLQSTSGVLSQMTIYTCPLETSFQQTIYIFLYKC